MNVRSRRSGTASFLGQPRRSRQRAATLAETGPVLWIFMLFIVLPFLDMISFVSGVTSVMLVSNWGARQAGPCNTFTDANQSIAQTENQLSAFRAFAKMSPAQANATSGVSIVCQVSKMDGTGTPAIYAYADRATIPNSPPDDPTNPITPANNTANSIYQYIVTGDYNVLPLINFAAAPFLHDIPGLGKAVEVKYSSTATVEHPDGLQN